MSVMKDIMTSWDENLLTAAENGNIKEVELCIKKGANLECRDRRVGRTPLMWAAGRGHLEVVTYLVTHGSHLEATSMGGMTPFMLAAMYGQLEVVTYLVTHGSQLDTSETRHGETALHYAARNGRIDITKCLIDQGCSPWVKSKQDMLPQDYDLD
ncbi:serine/threonine-protein phosphatase 6 regulatory ankyrin repeat subunit B-like [Mytilus trossulus]|uniref:serine/threonine-protein phosphatase 6 regulatory ankyrin repeat subunit B-like n=1 Tax=Mytilus trossulus TaxID=6551 RepID=UPI003007D099